MAERYDVVIVGSGSSGGVLAARLSEDPSRTVCLVEAGPDFPREAEVTPSFYAGGGYFGFAAVWEHDWGFQSEPLPWGRTIPVPRGRLVGGSSMTNGTLCVRGAPFDFARWEQLGATGWGWGDVRPCYEAVEREIPLKTYPRRGWQPVQEVFAAALEERGFAWHDDMNGETAWNGVLGPGPFNRRNEQRLGTLPTYIRRARGRANLTIRAETVVDRVTFAGTRATGISAIGPDGPVQIEAGLVVLSAGAIGTPAILLRSGVGPAAELAALGIDARHDLPVGKRLHDHSCVGFSFHAPDLADVCSPNSSVIARDPGNDWLCVAFAGREGEDCVLYFVQTDDPGLGEVTLTSADPGAKPRIRIHYETDCYEPCWELARELVGSRHFGAARWLPTSLEETVRDGITTGHHVAGTCGIGRVVAPDLHVYGLEGLAVADASIFPAHVSNNPNHTCYMIGERAAQLLG